MKNTIKLFGIVALIAVIGFAFAACGGDSSSDPEPGSSDPEPGPLDGTWLSSSGNEKYIFSGYTWTRQDKTGDTFINKWKGTFSIVGTTIKFVQTDKWNSGWVADDDNWDSISYTPNISFAEGGNTYTKE